MKKFVCPDCGKEYSEDNIPMECTTCGCPSDMIIINEISDVTPKMNFCPQCGSLLPSQQVRFCPNCGCELSSQKLRDVDTICPDCNSVITDVNKDCPICGCPSNMFAQRAKTKFVKGELLECPDCGQVFTEIIPADCPNCGCPSDKFKKPQEEKVSQNAYSQKEGSSLTILIIFIIVIIGGAFYFAYNRAQEAAEQARQEQYEREQAEQREREEREAQKRKKEQEEQNKRRKKALCNNKWKCVHGDPYGQCMLETVSFETNGTAWCSMTYYAGGNKIKSSSFDFTYYIDGDYIYVDGEKAYYYDGHSLELWPSGQRLKEVSRWEF